MSDFSKLKVKKNGKEYILNACTQDTEQNITGTKNFSKLTVNSKNVVTSVNGVNADENGNVKITTSGADLSGVVKSVNNIQPDENGNVSLEIPQAIGVTRFPDYEHPVTIFDVVNKGTNEDVNFDYTFTEDGYFHYRLLAGNNYNHDAIFQATITINESVFNIDERTILPSGSIVESDAAAVSDLIPVPKGAVLHIGMIKCGVQPTNAIEFFPLKNGNVIQADEVTGVVKSVNSIAPDENGNVQIDISDADLSGVVKSVNSIAPDADGNVDITIPKPITNIVGVTNNRNLGEVFYSALPLESSQVHSLDGSVLTDSSELYDYLESIKETNPDLFITNEQFEAEVSSTGKCNKFVLNTENQTVRIPKDEANNYIVIKSFERTFELNQPFSLLEPKWSDVPLNNPSWLLSNGQENSEENYPSVYELLLNEYNNGELKTETIDDVSIQYKQLNNGHKVVTDKTAYNSIFVKTGTAWYYLLDLENKTFVLPQTNGFMKFGNSNVFVKESLPNLKGSFAWGSSSGDDGTTAPFKKTYVSDYGASSSQSNPAKFINQSFDASTYSSVYQDSAHVNPNSVQGYLYFYVGEFVRPANIVNLGVIKDRLDLEVPGIKSDISLLKTDTSSYAFPGPKYDMLTIPTSASNLVAPENGWFVYQSYGGGSTSDYMFLRNNTNLMYGVQTRDQSAAGMYANIQVKKGETVYIEYIDHAANRNLKFIYASDKCE